MNLTPREEAELLVKLEPLVRRLARRCRVADEDGRQTGRLAALRAIRRYQPEHGVDLHRFACVGVWRALVREKERRARTRHRLHGWERLDTDTIDDIPDLHRALDLATVAARLDNRHLLILALLLAGEQQGEVGRLVGVSRARIGQLAARVLRLAREGLDSP